MIIVTCEHAVNHVPPEYSRLFKGYDELLDSHSGWDPGASAMARALSAALDAPLYEGNITRLLIDLNRSLDNTEGVFSKISRRLPDKDRERLVSDYYLPYRGRVEEVLRSAVCRGASVLHLSVHSFTPVMKGRERRCDIGILYDTARSTERGFSIRLRENINAMDKDLLVRLNYPYHGKTDGHAAYMRRLFPQELYVGIELEINQSIFYTGGRMWKELKAVMAASLASLCARST